MIVLCYIATGRDNTEMFSQLNRPTLNEVATLLRINTDLKYEPS